LNDYRRQRIIIILYNTGCRISRRRIIWLFDIARAGWIPIFLIYDFCFLRHKCTYLTIISYQNIIILYYYRLYIYDVIYKRIMRCSTSATLHRHPSNPTPHTKQLDVISKKISILCARPCLFLSFIFILSKAKISIIWIPYWIARIRTLCSLSRVCLTIRDVTAGNWNIIPGVPRRRTVVAVAVRNPKGRGEGWSRTSVTTLLTRHLRRLSSYIIYYYYYYICACAVCVCVCVCACGVCVCAHRIIPQGHWFPSTRHAVSVSIIISRFLFAGRRPDVKNPPLIRSTGHRRWRGNAEEPK